MNRNSKAISVAMLIFLLAFAQAPLFPQQSSFQTSFLTPASVRLANTGFAPSIVEAEHLPYIKQLARDNKIALSAFQPTASDLLIQQAEERFANGRKFYQIRDFDLARVEYDAAIADMLRASENPSDRRLFESKLEDMVDAIHHDDLSGLGAASAGDLAAFDKAPLDDILQMTFPVDPRIKDKVQTEVKSTASALPLVVNDTVLGYINYFNGRGHRTMEAGLARAGKYRPMISRILAEEGVPQELIHLAQAESGFLPRAVSRAAAEGMWQFVKFRGNQYGLRQTAFSDERLDPEKATRAAARHLHDLYNEFGDWYLAIAAYNCGPGNVEKAVERTGYADFWELRARGALPNETTAYVPIILAMTIMAKNAPAYGLDQVTPDEPLEYDTIHTDAPTNLALIGDLTDTSLPQLLQLNPALLKSVAPADFEIRVPKGTGEEVTAGLELVSPERRAAWRLHRIESGESLASIGHLFNASPAQIASANSMAAGTELAAGDRLLIPASYRESAAPVHAPASAGAATTKTASARTASPATHARGVVTARKTAPATAGARPHSAAVSTTKTPLHKSSATIAEAREHSRPALNR